MSGMFAHILGEGGQLKLANFVTLSRGLAVVPILCLLGTGLRDWAMVLYLAAASTDMIDGWLARRSGRASEFGAQLDAAVDNVFSLGILVFLAMAYPGLLARHGLALTILFGVPLAYLLVSWLMTRRLMMFHFLSAKIGAVLLFILWPLIAGTGWEGWIGLTATVVGLSRLEQVVFILRGGVDLDATHGWARTASSK